MVSLKDIALYCGVSTATVSKALSGQKDIGEKTKERVRAAAAQLGYSPNAAARALKTNHSYNLGVLFKDDAGSNLSHEYFSGVLNGFKLQAEQLGYDITFINNYGGKTAMTYLEHCRYRNFEGVAVMIADYEAPQVEELLCSELPIVTIDYVHEGCISVSSNNAKGIRELVEYVLHMGHERIAYVHGQFFSKVTKDRVSGFFDTMKQHGLTVLPEYMRECQYLNAAQAAEQTKYLLDLEQPPTCILYCDDTSLIGGRNVLLERGYRIPEDMSIAGYDGTQMSQLVHPKVTTLLQNTDEVGREAARRLIERIEHPKNTSEDAIVIDGSLLKGQSVGRIRNGE